MKDTEVAKEIKVVKRTITISFLNVDLIEIAEVFIAEEYVDSTEGPTWFGPMWDYLAKKGYCQKTRMKQEISEDKLISMQSWRTDCIEDVFGGY